jgi:hypothetical protein
MITATLCPFNSSIATGFRDYSYFDYEVEECDVLTMIGVLLPTLLVDYIRTVSGVLCDLVPTMVLLRSLV